MPKRSHGPRQGCRKVLTKSARDRGKVSISKQVKKYNVGDRVLIKIEPTIKKNVVHRRFINKSGEIVEKRGKSYRVRIKDGNKHKDVLVLPVHLKKM